MTDPTRPGPRQVVIAPGPGDKQRPGVVLRSEDTFLLIAFGTGTLRRDLPHVAVEENGRWFRSFGGVLYKATYFYRTNILVVRPDLAHPRRARIPLDLWKALVALQAPE